LKFFVVFYIADGIFPTYNAVIIDSRVLDKLSDKPAVFKGASSRTMGRQRDDQAG